MIETIVAVSFMGILALGAYLTHLSTKKSGDFWYNGCLNFHLGETVTINTSNGDKKTYTYQNGKPYGKFIIRKEGYLWKVICTFREENYPYLTYLYDAKTGQTYERVYKPRRLRSYITLSKEKTKKGLDRIEMGINEHIMKMDGKKEAPIQDKTRIKEGKYWFEESETDEIILRLDKEREYRLKENSEEETFTYIQYGKTGYTVTRKKETKKIIRFDIDSNWLIKMEHPEEIAQREESVWDEIKSELKKQQKKKEKMMKYWENGQSNIQKEWDIFEKASSKMATRLLKEKYLLDNQDKWYLEQTFPKRILQLKSLKNKEGTQSEEDFIAAQHHVLERLGEIQIRLTESRERSKKEVYQLIDSDNQWKI